jgi:hypothetical protein
MAAAAAKLLASMLLPWDAPLAKQLCPQQLQQQLQAMQHQCTGAVQFSVQAALKEPKALLLELQQQQQGDCCASVSCVR